MRCPFLREDQVKSCQAAPFRKYIARSATQHAGDLCTSADFRDCPTAARSREVHPDPTRCPFLQESLVQFCAAAPATTCVPWSQSPDLRCAHDGHRFCDLYLATVGPKARGPAVTIPGATDGETVSVDGVAVPGWLLYAPNHMWLDIGDDGMLHVGLDAFLAQLLGEVSALTFLTAHGTARPSVVLTVRGVDLTLAFHQPLHILGANTRLRFHLQQLVADPYGHGWLFEARSDVARGVPHDEAVARVSAGLLRGAAARAWMSAESRRLAAFVHERILPGRTAGEALLNDGGTASPDLLAHLERDEIVRLFAELVPPPVTPLRTS